MWKDYEKVLQRRDILDSIAFTERLSGVAKQFLLLE